MTHQYCLKYAVLAQDAKFKLWMVQLKSHELIYNRVQAILRINYDPSTYCPSSIMRKTHLLRYQIADIFGSADLEWRSTDIGTMEFDVGKDFCTVYKLQDMHQIEEH
jgi:hypothetical protein